MRQLSGILFLLTLTYSPVARAQDFSFENQWTLWPGDAVIRPNPAYDSYVKAAGNGTDFFAVWVDSRSGGSNIFGSRILADGTVVDTFPIRISSSSSATLPQIVWDGSNYFVVWEDSRNGNGDLYGARVRPDGTVIDTSGIQITSTLDSERQASMLFDGSNYIIAYIKTVGSYSQLYITRVSPSGIVDPVFSRQLTDFPANKQYPTIAYNGTNYLIAWTDIRAGYTVRAMGVDSTGNYIQYDGFPIGTIVGHNDWAGAASNGTDFLIVWHHSLSGVGGLSGRKVFADFTTGPVTDVTTNLNDRWAKLEYAQGSYHVTYQDHDGVTFQTGYLAVDDDAHTVPGSYVRLDPTGIYQFLPSIAVSGSRLAILWADYRRDNWDAQFITADVNAIVAQVSSTLSLSANTHTKTLLTRGADGVLALWEDNTALKRTIRGNMIDFVGNVLSSSDIEVSMADTENTDAAAVFTGSSFITSWISEDASGFSILTRNVELDSTTGAVSVVASSPYRLDNLVMAHAQGNTLQVWEDWSSSTPQLSGSIITSSGATAGLTIPDSIVSFNPTVASDGTDFLLVWQEFESSTYILKYLRILSDGTVNGPAAVLSADSDVQINPHAVFCSGNYNILWEDGRSGDYDIYSRRIATDGTSPDTADTLLVLADFVQSDVKAACDNDNLVIAIWRDMRSGNSDIYLGAFKPDYSWISPSLPLATTSVYEETPDVVVVSPRVFMTSYNGTITDEPYGSSRTIAGSWIYGSAPTAYSRNVFTPEDTPITFSLDCLEPDGDPLSYIIESGPYSGSIALEGNLVTYSPAAEWTGEDSITFHCNDGWFDSNSAQVVINVIDANDPPVAFPQTVQTDVDVPVMITLDGTDVDSAVLMYEITSGPVYGDLEGSENQYLYTTDAGFEGEDEFSFHVFDGDYYSAIATMRIIVGTANEPPVVEDHDYSLIKNTSVSFNLTGTDPENDLLTFDIVNQPVHGTLTIDATLVTYVPETGYEGSDSFTYRAYDGISYSNTAMIRIEVLPDNPPGSSDGCSCSNVSSKDTSRPIFAFLFFTALMLLIRRQW
ncbi:tandem-95 repeat protein [Myxococcota bacterium]|nr:tandem-95 repeat protein [Myxococcota bacterium]MBU1381073.1 tandem-95 repeat protein [Myxococcota bacterium]MBU1496319.1 tandem-95 repeat protein [Myxococcota bacterium]